MEIDELIEILNNMDIPAIRKEATKTNARWLLRNIRVRNGDHPRIDEVVDLLKDIARGKVLAVMSQCPNPGCFCGACD